MKRRGGDGGDDGGSRSKGVSDTDPGSLEIGVEEEGRLMIVLALVLQLMRQEVDGAILEYLGLG